MDISLGDIGWVLGALVAFAIVRILFTYHAAIAQAAGALLSSWPRPAPADMPDMDAVYIPVSHTDMDAGMDDMPRIGRRLSDDEVVILLAAQRRVDGKYRFSGNQIQALVGGDRNTVMRKIKELREGPVEPVYRPLSPEQRAQREALGLPNQ